MLSITDWAMRWKEGRKEEPKPHLGLLGCPASFPGSADQLRSPVVIEVRTEIPEWVGGHPERCMASLGFDGFSLDQGQVL